MIKGVNKQIIEISDTGNHSFERAILFVRPDSLGLGSDELDRHARDYLSQVRLRRSFYSHRGTWGAFGRIFAGALIGAGVMAIALLYFFV